MTTKWFYLINHDPRSSTYHIILLTETLIKSNVVGIALVLCKRGAPLAQALAEKDDQAGTDLRQPLPQAAGRLARPCRRRQLPARQALCLQARPRLPRQARPPRAGRPGGPRPAARRRHASSPAPCRTWAARATPRAPCAHVRSSSSQKRMHFVLHFAPEVCPAMLNNRH